MKWLFLFLLLVNIGLFMWNYPKYQEQQKPPIRPADVERLVLLRDIQSPAPEDQAGLDSTLTAEPEDVDTTEAEAEIAVAAGDPDPVSEPSPGVIAQPVEVAHNVQADLAPVKDATSPSEQDGKQDPRCAKLGPVADRADADQLSGKLRSMGISTEISSESRTEPNGFWVLVPPQPNRKTAVEIVNRLKQAGIKDLWRFTNGTLAHAISLGLFRDEERAEARRRLIAEKGFEVEVRPRFSQETAYWVSYNDKGDPSRLEAGLAEIKQRHPGLESQGIPCQKIARP